MKLEFSGEIFKKNTQISNLIKIRPVGAELFSMRMDGRMDMNLIVAFRNFAKAPKNVVWCETLWFYLKNSKQSKAIVYQIIASYCLLASGFEVN